MRRGKLGIPQLSSEEKGEVCRRRIKAYARKKNNEGKKDAKRNRNGIVVREMTDSSRDTEIKLY